MNENLVKINNWNKVNRFVSGTCNGVGFAIKNGELKVKVDEIGLRGIEIETRIRKAILNHFGYKTQNGL